VSSKKFTKIGKYLGVGERIRKIRGDLSQTTFGKILGVTAAAVSRYEAGRIPDEDIRKKIAEFGKVTDDWLLYCEGRHAPQIQEHAPEGYAAGLSDLETGFLIDVVTKVREVIKARNLQLTAAQEARLIVKTYDDCRAAHEPPSITHVERILLLRD